MTTTEKFNRTRQESERPFDGLAYCTVREVWKEAKYAIGAWVVLSLFIGLFSAASAYGWETATATIDLPHVPQGLRLFVVLAAGSWLYRGQTIPRLSFGAWVVWIGAAGLVALSFAYAPPWASIPLYVAIPMGLMTLETLAAKGRGKRERLHSSERRA